MSKATVVRQMNEDQRLVDRIELKMTFVSPISFLPTEIPHDGRSLNRKIDHYVKIFEKQTEIKIRCSSLNQFQLLYIEHKLFSKEILLLRETTPVYIKK